VFLYVLYRAVLAFTKVAMLKTLICPVRMLWNFLRTQLVTIFSTDPKLPTRLIIKYHVANCKIEAGFKEVKKSLESDYPSPEDKALRPINDYATAISKKYLTGRAEGSLT